MNALYQAFKGKKVVKRETLMDITRELRHRESNAERRLRELCHDGLISARKEFNEGVWFIVSYKNLKIKQK